MLRNFAIPSLFLVLFCTIVSESDSFLVASEKQNTSFAVSTEHKGVPLLLKTGKRYMKVLI
jgi:hypothetical protein